MEKLKVQRKDDYADKRFKNEYRYKSIVGGILTVEAKTKPDQDQTEKYLDR